MGWNTFENPERKFEGSEELRRAVSWFAKDFPTFASERFVVGRH